MAPSKRRIERFLAALIPGVSAFAFAYGFVLPPDWIPDPGFLPPPPEGAGRDPRAGRADPSGAAANGSDSKSIVPEHVSHGSGEHGDADRVVLNDSLEVDIHGVWTRRAG